MLQDVPGSYSYTSIISQGFTPLSAECLPVAEKATKFSITTPTAITRVAGGCAPVLIKTVALSTMTATITMAVSTSTSDTQRPIDCRPLGTKHRHNPTPKKMVEPTPDIITLDHVPVPIPVITLDDGNSDPNKLTINTAQPQEKSPTIVPEKKAQVGASPAMAKGIEAAEADIGLDVVKKSQAEAAAKACADNTLGSLLLSSHDSDPPSTIVTKPQKKQKSKKKRDSTKSQALATSSSDSDGHTDNKELLKPWHHYRCHPCEGM